MILSLLLICGSVLTCESVSPPKYQSPGSPPPSRFPPYPYFLEENDQVAKRQTEVSADVDHNKDTGITTGTAGLAHTFNDGNSKLSGKLDYNSALGNLYTGSYTHSFDGGNGKLNAQLSTDDFGNIGGKASYDHTFNDGRSKFGASVSHDPFSGLGAGLSFTHFFKKRDAALKKAKRWDVWGDYKNDRGHTHGNAGLEHIFNGGNSHVRGEYNHDSHGGDSYGFSFKHKFDKRHQLLDEAKRQIEVLSGADYNEDAGITTGTDPFSRLDAGLSFTHFLKKRDAALKKAKRWGVWGDYKNDRGHTHGNAGLEHIFNGGNSHVRGEYNHDSHAGDSYGFSFKHKFDKRHQLLDEAKRDMAKEGLEANLAPAA